MSDKRPLPEKPLAELSDAELHEELAERRKLRGVSIVTGHARHYASLELAEGAPFEAVEQAYERLRAKYEPFTTGNAQRSQAAKQLLDGLRVAYDSLRAALSRS